MFRNIALVILTIILIVFQLTWLADFNLFSVFILPLILLVFLIFFFNQPLNIVIAAMSGLFFDLYSINFFGFYFLLFMLEYFVLQFFTIQVLQNKKFLAFISLAALAAILWQVLILFAVYIFSFLHNLAFNQLLPANYFLTSLGQFIIYLIFVSLAYKILSFFHQLSLTTIN